MSSTGGRRRQARRPRSDRAAWALAWGFVALACGPAARPGTPRPPSRPSAGAYLALVRTRVALDEQPIATLRARALLFVAGRAGGALLTARVEHELEGDAGPSDLEARLSPDGSMRALRGRCGVRASATAARTLRHIVGALSGWDDDATAIGVSDVLDLETALRLGAEGERHTRTATTRMPAPSPAELSGWRLVPRGEARLALHRSREIGDAYAGRTRLSLAMPVHATDADGAEQDGELRAVTELRARPAEDAAPLPACGSGASAPAAPGGPSPHAAPTAPSTPTAPPAPAPRTPTAPAAPTAPTSPAAPAAPTTPTAPAAPATPTAPAAPSTPPASRPTPAPLDDLLQRLVRAINSRRARVTRCYETELVRNPELRGRLEITLAILESGEVANLRANDGSLPPALGACVIGVLADMRFSPGPEGGSVTYTFPFVFEPTD